MSDMFRGFYLEPPTYIPDNMHRPPRPPKTISLVSNNLDIILDKKGKKRGYSWNYGETVSIPLSVEVEVRVEGNAYCTWDKGAEPTFSTPGMPGQKYYNLKDIRSWICTSYVPDSRAFIWTEEPRFTFPENGEKLVCACPDMEGKYILAEFINFRGEQMFEKVYYDTPRADWTLDTEESLALPRGIYDLYIYVADKHEPELLGRKEYKKLTARYDIVIR